MGTYKIVFPMKIFNNSRNLNKIFEINEIVKSGNYSKVVFDFSKTNVFETNMLAVFCYVFEEFVAKKIQISISLPNFLKDNIDAEEALRILFEYYSKDTSPVLYPRKIGIRNKAEEEKLLLKDLRMLQLSEYEKVKILLSELIANLKMHTIYQDGSCAGYHNFKDKNLVFSIVNYDITIAKRIRQVRSIEFQNDYEAIRWALYKNNSTRIPDETGGLGLYLLRKYISQLKGSFYIISGDCYVQFDERCYDSQNENAIYFWRRTKLAHRYEGTVITLCIPFMLEKKKKNNKMVRQLDINTL